MCECLPLRRLSPPKSRRLSGGGCPDEERALPACRRMQGIGVKACSPPLWQRDIKRYYCKSTPSGSVPLYPPRSCLGWKDCCPYQAASSAGPAFPLVCLFATKRVADERAELGPDRGKAQVLARRRWGWRGWGGGKTRGAPRLQARRLETLFGPRCTQKAPSPHGAPTARSKGRRVAQNGRRVRAGRLSSEKSL